MLQHRWHLFSKLQRDHQYWQALGLLLFFSIINSSKYPVFSARRTRFNHNNLSLKALIKLELRLNYSVPRLSHFFKEKQFFLNSTSQITEKSFATLQYYAANQHNLHYNTFYSNTEIVIICKASSCQAGSM